MRAADRVQASGGQGTPMNREQAARPTFDLIRVHMCPSVVKMNL